MRRLKRFHSPRQMKAIPSPPPNCAPPPELVVEVLDSPEWMTHLGKMIDRAFEVARDGEALKGYLRVSCAVSLALGFGLGAGIREPDA